MTRVVVLTGGPGGGKTTLIEELRRDDAERKRWRFVPEAAPMLFAAGMKPTERSFEVAVVQLQMELEAGGLRSAPDEAIVVCHRGTLDALAYWRHQGWPAEEFFTAVGSSEAELLARYGAVLQLDTTARDAIRHYRRWPDAHRIETATGARVIDELCAAAWQAHPRYARISNVGIGWPEKSDAARRLLDRWHSELTATSGGADGIA
jgi:hypothetical protein